MVAADVSRCVPKNQKEKFHKNADISITLTIVAFFWWVAVVIAKFLLEKPS